MILRNMAMMKLMHNNKATMHRKLMRKKVMMNLMHKKVMMNLMRKKDMMNLMRKKVMKKAIKNKTYTTTLFFFKLSSVF